MLSPVSNETEETMLSGGIGIGDPSPRAMVRTPPVSVILPNQGSGCSSIALLKDIQELDASCTCPDCNSALTWSDYSGEGYEIGWVCDQGNCGSCSTNQGRWRWVCQSCQKDFCTLQCCKPNECSIPISTGEGDVSRFTYEPPERKPYPGPVGFVRRHLFKSFIGFVFVGTAVYLALDALVIDKGDTHAFLENLKLFSVPLVSLLFTWFHVWLALIMMFYPINFYGCPRRPIVPQWLDLPINGWQGIVPRKAGLMAQRCCDKMIGNICTVDEFAARIDPDHFWETLHDVFGNVCSEVLQKILNVRWPKLWQALPPSVQEELALKVCEETKKSFLPAMVELKTNITSILDIKKMAADTLANEPELMVNIFRTVAARELVFITHVAAVMGFLLGLVQVCFYIAFSGKWPYTDYILLPVSGLVIGYFTNWLALKMTFAPVWPNMLCGNYINIQGVFLKRQKEASEVMASAICDKVISAEAMLDYMFRNPNPESAGAVERVLEIYKRHINESLDKQFGGLSGIMPVSFAQEIDSLKEDVVTFALEILPSHTERIECYMDAAMQVKETLSWRLARIPPDEFEDIIHPIFKQDEWILLFVGGFLGVVIGLLQAAALQNIN